MGIAVADRAIERDQREQPFRTIGQHVLAGELSKTLEDGGLVGAVIFGIGAAPVEDAEVLEVAVSCIVAPVEAVDHERAAILRQLDVRDIEPASRGGAQAEIFIRGEFRVVTLPEFHDMRRAPDAGAVGLSILRHGAFVADQQFGLHAAYAGYGGETLKNKAMHRGTLPIAFAVSHMRLWRK